MFFPSRRLNGIGRSFVIRSPGKESGAALVLALLVVVTVTLLASALSSDFLVTYKRVENQLLSKQAFALLRGAEGIARSTLQADFQLSTDTDHASEGWLNITQSFPLDQGMISGTICDLQGRFNLNSLAGTSSSGRYTVDQATFVRLLQSVTLADGESIDQQQAEDIGDAVIDWIDPDSDERENGGAESHYYNDLELPYRAANRELLSVSELLWVKGIDRNIQLALAPFVVALPSSVSINVNTASGVLIRSINELSNLHPLSDSDAQTIIEVRDGFDNTGPGFSSISDFVSAHPVENLDTSRLSVKSDYFLLDASIQFLDRKFRMYSILHRDPTTGNIKTIARANNGLGACYALVEEDEN